MRVAAVILDDGRPQYLSSVVKSLDRVSPIDIKILIDDTGPDDSYTQYLEWTYQEMDEQVHHQTRRGLGGAVKSAWTTALEHDITHVWHQEDDQVILNEMDLRPLAALLESHPNLAQVAIKRTAYSPEEHAAGGIVEAFPHFYTECTDGNVTWLETDHLFVFSPSLIPRHVIELALANTDTFLEDNVTAALWAHGYRSCYWGAMYDPPLSDHIGSERSRGYRW